MTNENGEPRSAHSYGRTLARGSWLLFVGALVVNRVGRITEVFVLTDLVVLVVLLVCIVLAVLALASMRTQGRKAILIPALIGLALDTLLVVVWVTNFLGTHSANRSGLVPEAALARVADEVNKTLPRMLDQETEMSTTMALPGVFVYKYRLVNYSVEQLEPAKLVAKLRPAVINTACTSPPTRDGFLKRGVAVRYTYEDRDRKYIAKIDVSAADCKW